MKKLIFLTFIFALAAFPAAAQKTSRQPEKPKPAAAPKTPVKAAPKKPAAPVTVAEIPAAEWAEIVKALETENWARAEQLSAAALKKLKADNEKKQAARLRYFYLYALAGKTAAGAFAFSELEREAKKFVGHEFLMPAREIRADCRQSLNYVCPVKSDPKSARVTATNKSFSSILAFEYVRLAENFDAAENNSKKAFLGGTLEKAEFNPDKSKVWIMRLFFEKGFADLVA